jgi:hypothetical protein
MQFISAIKSSSVSFRQTKGLLPLALLRLARPWITPTISRGLTVATATQSGLADNAGSCRL